MSLVMVVIWVLMGLLAGLLAGVVTQGGGYWRKGDVVLGLVGSLGAGGLLWVLGISQGLVAVAVVVLVGAATSIVFQRTVWPSPVLAHRSRGR